MTTPIRQARVRSGAPALAFLVASTLVHLIILGRRGAVLEIEPHVTRCHAGEAVRLSAVVRAGSRRSPVKAPSWQARSGNVRLLVAGVFRCDVEGSATVTARKDDLEAQAHIEIGPPIIDVDSPPLTAPDPAIERPARVAPTQRRRSPPPEATATPAPAAPDPSPAPAAAGAAEILTAEPTEDATTEEKTEIVSNPGGERSGSGVVAAGGTAAVGVPGAKADGVLGGTGSGRSTPTASLDLSRPPAITDRDPCRGYFPDEAFADKAVVEMDVDVAANGRVRQASVLAETPPDQGFGSAARRCFGAMRLDPALDRHGRPTNGRMTFRFRFAR